MDEEWVLVGGLTFGVLALYCLISQIGYERKAYGKYSDDDY